MMRRYSRPRHFRAAPARCQPNGDARCANGVSRPPLRASLHWRRGELSASGAGGRVARANSQGRLLMRSSLSFVARLAIGLSAAAFASLANTGASFAADDDLADVRREV